MEKCKENEFLSQDLVKGFLIEVSQIQAGPCSLESVGGEYLGSCW